jgi:nitrogen fixation/metabolism regulation signal transduction histidine kinase
VYKQWRKNADEAEAKDEAEKRRARLHSQQPQESQDSITVEVVDKKAKPLNKNDGGDDDMEDPKAK